MIFSTHVKDNVLKGFSYEDLIETVQCNEYKVNEKIVMKVFKEMLKQSIDDAQHIIETDMDFILSEIDS